MLTGRRNEALAALASFFHPHHCIYLYRQPMRLMRYFVGPVTGCVAAGADRTSDCHSCCEAITGVSGVLKCDICVHIFHPGCVGVSEAVLAVLLPVIDATGWVCSRCRTQSRQQLLSLQAGRGEVGRGSC